MLERAVSCIEPTAQLFARRIEPPVRSVRVLGPSFWQNGGNDLHIPPWWPRYLKSVRQGPERPNLLPADGGNSQLAKVPRAPSPGSSRPAQDRKAHPRSVDAPPSRRRRYCQSSLRRQLPQAASDDVDDIPRSSTSQPLSTGTNEPRNNGKKHVEPGLQGQTLIPDAQHQRLHDSHASAPVQRMSVEAKQQELHNLSRLGSHSRPRFDAIWRLFVASPDQHGIASTVLAHLARSSERRDQDRALQVFSIMEVDDRSKVDYDLGVRVAVQMRRYSIAMRICQEAANKSADQTCRQILLDGCLSQGLWKTTARVWTNFFEPSLASERDRVSSWDVVEAQRSLPTFLSHLCNQLQQDDPGLQAEHTTLLAVVDSLSLHMFKSHKIMAFILPRGLFQLLWQLKQLSILEETHHKTALKTLISSEMSRRRTDLAVMVYRNLRFMFPHGYVSSASLVGLIRLCDKDGYPLDIFRYWLQESKQANVEPRRKIYWHLMWAFARQGDVNSADDLFRESMELLGPPTETKHLNPRLYAHAVTGGVDAVQAILQEAKTSYGLSGDIVSWNILLFACSRSKEPRRIFAAFDAMDKRKIRPDAVTFETLIGVCSRIGDAAAASSLVEVAKDYNVSITDDMLAMIVHARCLNDEADEAENLAQGAQAMGIATPIRTWNNLLRHYAFQADFRAIRRIRAFMSGTGVDPDDMSHAAVLTSLVRVGRTEDALRLLRSLHFDRTVTATSFHYSIILHGFAMEKNRNMVEVIYREMEERFPQLSPSAQLAKLHTQAHRVWIRLLEGSTLSSQGDQTPFEKRFKLDIQQPISFIDNIMSQQSTRITSDPQPGLHRRPAHEAVPSIYPETLASIMALNRQPIQAQRLLDHYRSSTGQVSQGRHEGSKNNVQDLTTRLLVATRLALWNEVHELWCKILHLGVETGLPGSSVLSLAPSEFQMHNPQGMMNHLVSTLEGHGLKVLPATRFRLSVSLSFYMQALGHQKRQDELIGLVENFQRLGFALSSKNWNSYIQVLCRSPTHAHQILAYGIFEEKMLANTPPWRVISRSEWVATQVRGRPRRLPVSRELLEQIRPGQIMPTYFTMIFLASVFWGSRSPAGRENVTKVQDLRRRFPQVVSLIETIPRQHDRVRRLVLTGKNAHREPMKHPRYHRISRAGIAGSKRQLDHVPVDRLLEVADTLSSGGSSTLGRDKLQMRRDLETATLVEGETIREMLWRERRDELETQVDREARTLKRTSKLLERVEQLRKESISQPLVMHEPTGDPRLISRPRNLSAFPGEPKNAGRSKRRFVVDGSDLKTAKSELRERRKANGRIPISAMQLGQRLVPPKSRRQQQEYSFSIRKARRLDIIRQKEEVRKSREQTFAEQRRDQMQLKMEHRAKAADRYVLVAVSDAKANKASGPTGKPFVPRGRTWRGDTPGSKLLDKLLPKRSTLPYDREKVRAAKLAAQEKKRQDTLGAALASPNQETPVRPGSPRQITGDSRKSEIHKSASRGRPDVQIEDRQEEKGQTHEPWKWSEGEVGWKSV